MKLWRSKALLLAGIAGLGLAIPALSQEAPESLLPPGFGDPAAPMPPPADQPGNSQEPLPPRAPPPGRDPLPPLGEVLATTTADAAAADLATLQALEPPKLHDIPDFARRPTDLVGVIGPDQWGLAPDAFARSNGRFVSSLMRRLDAPLPSRWTSILLRRALFSKLQAPALINPVDWTAERAWLLLRMGEADAARLLVNSVDVDSYTPKMFAVAVQAALANADPGGLCPLVEDGRKTSDEPVWALADAMCAGLEGEAARASSLIDRARRGSGSGGIDVTLAEKIVGAGENTRRAVTVQWDNVDSLNSWRFGLAAAAGVQIPDRLLGQVGPHVRAWQARAPMLPVDQRTGAAHIAASLGVFSNASLVEMYSLIADDTDPSEISESVGGRLRVAYVGRDAETRVGAMRGLWEQATSPNDRYARQILTASAAARLKPTSDVESDVPELLASMLSAGWDAKAARWSPIVDDMGGEAGDRAWALLALGSPTPRVDMRVARINAFLDNDASADNMRGRMLFAALAGLDRIRGNARGRIADEMEVDLDGHNRWSLMLERAVRNGQQGTVVLLAGIGMQTGGWAGVPPQHFYRIISALRRVGLDYEARMVAAEALARL